MFILIEPYYGYHLQTLLSLGVVPRYVKTSPPDWALSLGELEAACSPKTRGIMLNTPANPSGKVFSRAELEMIAKLAIKRDLFVFTDEIYEYFLYDRREHVSPLSIPGMRERTIAISGLSKTFSITGWRIGYAISAPQWSQTIGYFNDLVYVCAPAPLQIGVARGLNELAEEYYVNLRAEYARKRDRICTALQKAGLPPCVPQGSYYVLADISRVPGRTSKERAMRLLKDSGVACVPGEAFYHELQDGQTLGRFCYAKKDEVLDAACRRLETC